MQYSFDFTKKPETPDLDLNHLDYTQLSGFAEFVEKLTGFNERYGLELVATKSSRWQPGTYNKIKANMNDIMYPHWKKRRGANSIQKLLERNNWRYGNFRDELNELDIMLFKYRKQGMELYADDDLEEAKRLLYNLLEKYTAQYEDTEIDISPVPHFGRCLRGYIGNYDDTNTDRVSRLYPEINNNNEIIGIYNTLMYDSIEHANDIKYDLFGETNPGKWFINLRVKLKDINIKLTNADMTNTYSEFPYGDMIVCFTFDLTTLLVNYRRIQAKQHLIKTEYVGTTATVFPEYSGIEHPFVYRKVRSGAYTNPIAWFNTYGNGNICLGELNREIYTSLFTGNIELLKSYLNIWANSYSAGVTSPLNTISHSTFGVRNEWDTNVRAIVAGNSLACVNQIKDYTEDEDKQHFVDTFCNNCALAETCKLANRLGVMLTSWMDDANDTWIKAYNKLSEHLINELDTKQIYEIFADLYYYHTNNKFNHRNIRRVFNVSSSIYDYNDYNNYMQEFHDNGPTEDNIIKMFELFNRNFVLIQIYNDNPQMFEELRKKTLDCTFDEAIEKLTTRTLEDNHYSWLFATGSVSRREDYYSYIKSLNSRKEGIRYAYS